MKNTVDSAPPPAVEAVARSAKMAPVVTGACTAVALVAALFTGDAVGQHRFDGDCIERGGSVQHVYNATRAVDNVRSRCVVSGQVVATRK